MKDVDIIRALKEVWNVNNPTKEDIEFIKRVTKENKISYKQCYNRFNKFRND